MQTPLACSNKTELKDRTLFYDGDSVVPADKVINAISTGQAVDGLFVDEVTEEIRKFNSFVPASEQITTKGDDIKPLSFDWNLPEKYANIDPILHIAQIFYDDIDNIPMDEFDLRKKRLIHELRLYEELELIPILRVLIYIINTLEEKDLVWGVGRGSSVSSYVLYILGVHDVDSFKYDLNITDFLRT